MHHMMTLFLPKVACAHDFIMEQPEGYATRIGEGEQVCLEDNDKELQLHVLFFKGLLS